jgi:hypothetical protein
MRNEPILHEAIKAVTEYVKFMPIENGQFYPDDRGCLPGYTVVNSVHCSYGV